MLDNLPSSLNHKGIGSTLSDSFQDDNRSIDIVNTARLSSLVGLAASPVQTLFHGSVAEL